MEWLGEVPEEWDLKKLKYAFFLQRGHDLSNDDFIEGEYPVMGSNGIIGYHNCYTTQGPSITVGRSGSVGEVNYVQQNFWAHNTALYVVYFYSNLPRYVYYILKLIDLKNLSFGTAVGTLNRNNIHTSTIAIPPLPEQHAIAAFLDRETARIDALIAKKEWQIELLQEKRAALISHTVTKGLDPNAKMKDSGVEWLGEVPEHWEIKRIKYVSPRINEKTEEETDLPYIGLENIESWTGKLIPNEENYEAEGQSNKFQKGDVLFNKLRPYLAKVLVATEIGRCTSELLVLRPKMVTQYYLFYFLLSKDFVNTVDSSTYGAKMPRANWNFIGDLLSPLPPAHEQEAIATFLNIEAAKIDGLINKINNSIGKVNEYRAALISAAVTGKIDVRQEILA